MDDDYELYDIDCLHCGWNNELPYPHVSQIGCMELLKIYKLRIDEKKGIAIYKHKRTKEIIEYKF